MKKGCRVSSAALVFVLSLAASAQDSGEPYPVIPLAPGPTAMPTGHHAGLLLPPHVMLGHSGKWMLGYSCTNA